MWGTSAEVRHCAAFRHIFSEGRIGTHYFFVTTAFDMEP